VPADVPRDHFLAAKLGYRREFRDSNFELGILHGAKLNSAERFTFILPDGQLGVECPVSLATKIEKCVDDAKLTGIDRSASAALTVTRDHPQFGAFVNFRLRFPLPLLKLKFLSEETGQYFRDHDRDLEFDTKYLVTWKNSIEVPVFGNFSLAPSLEQFFYKNKGNPATRSAAQNYRGNRFSIDFKYSFDRRSGMRWLDALAYPSPAGGK
jgi:hypothetical protein